MPTYSYEIGVLGSVSGTVTINGSASVVGSSTAFLTQFAVGYLIVVGSETRVVSVITDDTHLTVSAAFASSLSGQTAQRVNLINLKSLSTPVDFPKSSYQPFADYQELGNGAQRGLGSPLAAWNWGWLTRHGTAAPQAQRDMLKTFCADAAAAVYIRTRKNDTSDTYAYFSAQMNWPREEAKQAGRREDFTLNFSAMTEITVS